MTASGLCSSWAQGSGAESPIGRQAQVLKNGKQGSARGSDAGEGHALRGSLVRVQQPVYPRSSYFCFEEGG